MSPGCTPRHRRQFQSRPVAEDVVACQRDPRQVGDAALVAGDGVDLVAGRLRQRDLRRRDLVADAGRGGKARIHLEVDVRPAARIAAREDRRERHDAAGVGLLHASQIVLIRDTRRVQRVASGPVAVPEVHGLSRQRRARRRGDDRQDERQRHAVGRARQAREARSDIASDDSGEAQDVWPVRAISRVRAGRLGRNLRHAGARPCGRAGACIRAAGTCRVGRTAAAEQLKRARAHAESRRKAENAAAIHRGAGGQEVAVEAAKVVVVVVQVLCGHCRHDQ